MIVVGMLMLLVACWGGWLFQQGRLDKSANFLRLCTLMGPSGFVAVIAGWFTAEVGRQPYTVYGLLRTVDSVSPVTANSVGMSLIVFVFTYTIIFFSGIFYISKLIIAGPGKILPSPEEMESDAVLSTRASIGDLEHELNLSTHMTRK